jgi:hypothetical protein
MSYGIEIRNQYGEIILDNTPYSVMRVLDGYPATTSRHTAKRSSLFSVNSGEAVFIRASNDGGVGGAGDGLSPNSSLDVISTDSGDLTYVKIKSCENLTASGYGLAVFSNEGTPKLVFSDSIKFAKLVYANYLSVPSTGVTVNIPALSVGMHRYVSLYSFGLCGNSSQNDADMLRVSFGLTTATFSKEAWGFGSKTFTSVNSFQIPIGITIIEC